MAAFIPKIMPNLDGRYAMDATYLHPHDGDSFTIVIRLPFRQDYQGNCRLARVNAPELTAPGGPEAATFTQQWLDQAMIAAAKLPTAERDWPLLVQGRNLENFGRPLLEVWRKSDQHNLSDDLLLASQAKPYALTIEQGIKP